MFRVRVVLSILCLILCFAPLDRRASLLAACDDWPAIRGTRHDGISQETGLVSSWPASGPPVLWTRELGQGYSSFIAWDDRVATQYQTLSGQYLICLDGDTGATLWEYRYSWPYDPAGVYPGPRSSPTYADGWIYFSSPTGYVGCVNALTGQLRWSIELGTTFNAKLPGFGYAGTPIVANGTVLLPVGGKGASMVALDAATGKTVWQAGDDLASYTPAYPIEFQGRKIVIGYLQNALVAHDLETGRLLFRHSLSSGYDEHSAWPIFSAPYLWIASPFQNGSELLEIVGEQEMQLRTIRKSPVLSNDIFSSILADGAIFGFDLHEAQAKTHRTSRGIFRCIDFLSGEVCWSVGTGRLRRDTSNVSIASAEKGNDPNQSVEIGHATVLLADGKLILFNDLGELILASANRERYEELGRASVLSGEICWTQPALSRSRLFVRNHSRAACLFLGDPATLKKEIQGKLLLTQDIPQEKLWDVAGFLLGVEPEYLFDAPKMNWLWNWFLVSFIGIFLGSYFVLNILGFARNGRSPTIHLATMQNGWTPWIFWSIVFVLGAAGTTVISRWQEDFVFTWPVCLFAAWQIAIANMVSRNELTNWRIRIRSGGSALFLLFVSLAYFMLCRRLSLVFEWAFLGGFASALPFSLAGKFWFRRRSWNWIWEVISTSIAFIAFYWSAALFLLVRY